MATALEYEGEMLLFDCGEHTQLQIKKMKLALGKFRKIFISHWHGDHVLGLPGLLMTLANTQGIEEVEIHGPKGTSDYLHHMRKSMIFDSKLSLKIFEHEPKEREILTVDESPEYCIKCVKLNHSVPCIAYSFEQKDVRNIDKDKAKLLGLEQSPLLARSKLGLDIELEGKRIPSEDLTYVKKGKKICFVFDTRPCLGIDLLVKNADYLIMEATYIFDQHADKAQEYDHMSAKETAEIALRNNVQNLVITHFSQRYKDTKDIEAEAKEIFEKTCAAYDLMSLPLR